MSEIEVLATAYCIGAVLFALSQIGAQVIHRLTGE